jgi:hypothetical protein
MNETSAKDTAALGGQAPCSLPAERSNGTTDPARMAVLETMANGIDTMRAGLGYVPLALGSLYGFALANAALLSLERAGYILTKPTL